VGLLVGLAACGTASTGPDPQSDQLIASIGADRNLHPDFGASWNGGPFGIPYVVVRGDAPKVTVTFTYADESDPGPYPIPPNPPVEGGPSSTGDRHILIVDADNWVLYELFAAYPSGTGWTAGSGAIFDLKRHVYRPAGWTSADAAGLPILPGLVRWDEVEAGEITHALRFTVRRTRRAYVLPARHWASSDPSPLLPPMGAGPAQGILRHLGIPAESPSGAPRAQEVRNVVADNGSDWFLSGVADVRWNDAEVNALKAVRGRDFEVVATGPVVTGQ
jgi:hypothetical protein